MHVRHERPRFAMFTSVKMWSPTYSTCAEEEAAA